MKHSPFVSIIIVNFNGKHLLEECLPALFQITYPKQSYEVIIVDNNSSDDSVRFIKLKFPQVLLIESSENSGFTGGNNLGYAKAKGEYIVLLNSDVIVDSLWLDALVKAAIPNKVGCVNSRLRYSVPFIELTIQSGVVPRSQIYRTIDHSPVGVLVEDIVAENEKLTANIFYKSGFYDKKNGDLSTRRVSGTAKVLLPYNVLLETNSYVLTMHGFEANEATNIPVKLLVGTFTVSEVVVQPFEAKQLKIVIHKKDVESSFRWLIQNAGNIVLSSGYSKDRGSVVVLRDNERKEGYEEESEYFLKPTSLLSICGASCLIKRSVIDHVGFLDGHYFMYYEDVEFSLRAWRGGWGLIYAPDSIAYHKHRSTTGEGETTFLLSHIERNHLSLVWTHMSFPTLVSQTVLFLLRFLISSTKYLVFSFKDNELRSEVWRIKYNGRKIAFQFLLTNAIRLLVSRYKLHSYWPMDYKKLRTKLY